MEQRINQDSFASLQADWPHWQFSAERGGLMARTIDAVFSGRPQAVST